MKFNSEKAKNENVMSIKTLEKKVQCKKCQKAFHSEEDLRRHDNSKHCKRPIICNSCEKTFSKSSDLEDHLEEEHKVEKSFSCDECNMQFTFKEALSLHKKKQHSTVKKTHYCNV